MPSIFPAILSSELAFGILVMGASLDFEKQKTTIQREDSQSGCENRTRVSASTRQVNIKHITV